MKGILLLLVLWGDPACSSEITALQHDNFHRRELASKRLEAMGWRALPQLFVASNFRDPEQRRRAEQILDRYFYVNPNHESMEYPSVYCLAGPLHGIYSTYPHEGPLIRRCDEEPQELGLEPVPFNPFSTDRALAFLSHVYYARTLHSEGVSNWAYTPDREVRAMELLIRDCRLLGVSKERIQTMLDYARKRSNPEPPGMPKPPGWLRYLITGSTTAKEF